MKKNITLSAALITIIATSIFFSGCNKPTERASVVNPKAAANIFTMTDIKEVTADIKTVYFSENAKPVDNTLERAKIEGKVQDLLKKVTLEPTKKMLDDHLKIGDIAIVVLDDQIKILKVVPEINSTFDLTLISFAYLAKMKSIVKTSDAKAQASLVSELENIKDKSPAQLGEKFGLAEITSIKIEKHGSLENERTDYNEKKSTLNVADRPFDVSTHILVGDEVGVEPKKTTDSDKE